MMDYVRCLCRKSREKATDETPQDVLQYRMDRAEMNLPGSMESGVMLLRFRKFLGSDLNGIGFLDDDEREVIRLRFFEGKSCREAAVVMNVSAATVCRAERRALTRLRKNFVQKFCGPAAASGHQADIRAVSCESVDFDDDGDCESTGLHAILASLTL